MKTEEDVTAIKQEQDDMSIDEEKGSASVAPVTPSKTPQKRGRKKADGDADAETPTKKKRATPTKATSEKGPKARPMPTSFENASEEDKMMLRMKDEEGKGWNEIREAWTAMTGEAVGKSTLSGRYGRIKANFIVFKKEDEEHLLKAKKEIEEKFENEKWHRVADAIEAASGNKYPPAAVQKKFKELQKNVGTKEEEDDS